MTGTVTISFVIGALTFVLCFYLLTCIRDKRNPLRPGHNHKWEEEFNETVTTHRNNDFSRPPYKKELVIIHKCTICGEVKKSVTVIFH